MPGLWVRASPGARYFERRTPKHFSIRPWQDGIVFSFYEMPQIALNIMTVSSCRHRWFSGRMLACHAGGPGSIPGRCKIFFHLASPTYLKPSILKGRLGHDSTCNWSVYDVKNWKKLHRPGIEPGPPAWQASILPLNQRCLAGTKSVRSR